MKVRVKIEKPIYFENKEIATLKPEASPIVTSYWALAAKDVNYETL